MNTTINASCGHTVSVEHEEELDDRQELVARTNACPLCIASAWLLSFDQQLPDLTGEEEGDSLEVAQLQRIITIRDIERKQKALRDEALRRLREGQLNPSIFHMVLSEIDRLTAGTYSGMEQNSSIEYWIETGFRVSSFIEKITFEKIIEMIITGQTVI